MEIMERLSSKLFHRYARKAFGEVLEPFGFLCQGTKYSTFWRKINKDIYHFILPDLSLRNFLYDLHVFPHSPVLDEEFRRKFPDDLGFTTDSFSYLHSKTGVGPDQQGYRCRTKEGFLRNFNNLVKPALLNYAVPYLDQIKTIEDMSHVIKKGPFVDRIAKVLNNKA